MKLSVPAAVLIHGDEAAAIGGEAHQLLGFGHGGREGLVDDYVAVGFETSFRVGVVRIIRRGDDHRLIVLSESISSSVRATRTSGYFCFAFEPWRSRMQASSMLGRHELRAHETPGPRDQIRLNRLVPLFLPRASRLFKSSLNSAILHAPHKF